MANKVINMISGLKHNSLCDEYAKDKLDIAISHIESLKDIDIAFRYTIINKAFNMVHIAYNHVCKDIHQGDTFDLFNEILGELDDMQ